eukprot:IDg23249t1
MSAIREAVDSIANYGYQGAFYYRKKDIGIVAEEEVLNEELQGRSTLFSFGSVSILTSKANTSTIEQMTHHQVNIIKRLYTTRFAKTRILAAIHHCSGSKIPAQESSNRLSRSVKRFLRSVPATPNAPPSEPAKDNVVNVDSLHVSSGAHIGADKVKIEKEKLDDDSDADALTLTNDLRA